MATDIAKRKSALVTAKACFNLIASVFNPIARELYAIPELNSVLHVFADVAAAAKPGAEVISLTIANTNKEPDATVRVPPTADDKARAQQLSDALTLMLQSYEGQAGLDVVAIVLERDNAGLVKVGAVVVAA